MLDSSDTPAVEPIIRASNVVPDGPTDVNQNEATTETVKPKENNDIEKILSEQRKTRSGQAIKPIARNHDELFK